MRHYVRRPSTARERAGVDTLQTVERIVRRVGVTLNAALDCAIRELVAHDLQATAETLRDELKPLCDSLIHFEALESVEDDHGDAS